MDHGIVGGIVNNLPIEKMVAAPLTAAINAQSQMSMSMANFIDNVGIDKDGNMRMVTFKYDETVAVPAVVDEKGEVTTPASTKQESRYIQAPFLAMTGIPNLAIEQVNISFELEVNTAEDIKENNEEKITNETTAGYKSWWSPVSVNTKFTGAVTHSKEQTRHTDTRAKYTFNVSARKQSPPEALMRIIDTITNAAANPAIAAPRTADNLTVDGHGAEGKKLLEDKPAQ